MGKKDRTFASKVAKGAVDHSQKCSVCGDAFHLIKVVSTLEAPESKSLRFQEKMVRVCKCNHAEVYGG
ncbi:hypothetical protein JXJ21_17510 [candidate division KSB1 bacterium]|nr:hypothetical protein [candidate division KSB1 bacterium]